MSSIQNAPADAPGLEQVMATLREQYTAGILSEQARKDQAHKLETTRLKTIILAKEAQIAHLEAALRLRQNPTTPALKQEEGPTANLFPTKRQRTSSPPRTFTKGLVPIPPHPKRLPIVGRSRPPIKPAVGQRKTVSTPPASAPGFPKRPRLLDTQPAVSPPTTEMAIRSSIIRTLECTCSLCTGIGC
jgi:hypothetical protein